MGLTKSFRTVLRLENDPGWWGFGRGAWNSSSRTWCTSRRNWCF